MFQVSAIAEICTEEKETFIGEFLTALLLEYGIVANWLIMTLIFERYTIRLFVTTQIGGLLGVLHRLIGFHKWEFNMKTAFSDSSNPIGVTFMLGVGSFIATYIVQGLKNANDNTFKELTKSFETMHFRE